LLYRERILLIFGFLSCILVPSSSVYVLELLSQQNLFSDELDVVLRRQIEFRIDSNFSPEEQQLILEAFDEWNTKSESLVQLTGKVVVIPQWEQSTYFADDVSTIYDASSSYWPAKTLDLCNSKYLGVTIGAIGDIFIIKKNKEFFKVLVAHEIGHVLMGSYHSENPRDLMFPYLSGLTTGITDNDIKALKSFLLN